MDLEEAAYFFLIDDHPTANWGHPCRYVWVNEADGSLTCEAHNSPPTLCEGPLSPGQGAPVVRLTELVESAQAFDPALCVTQGGGAVMTSGIEMSESFHSIVAAFPPEHRWALIVNGGYDIQRNHVRYWGDISNIYCALVQTYGYLDDHIIVCNSDGCDGADDRIDVTFNPPFYDSSPLDLDNDGDNDINYPGTYDGVTQAIADFYHLTPCDFWFFFSTNHGNLLGDWSVELTLWNDGFVWSITDVDFAARTGLINAAVRVYTMEQCYSGGFIDDCCRPNEIIATAGEWWEPTSAGDTFNRFDEFVYEWTAAVRGCYADVGDSTQPWLCGTGCAADANGDGRVSMWEAFVWAESHDEAPDYPDYCDNPPGLGEVVDLNGPFDPGPSAVQPTTWSRLKALYQ
jgi:hypothetical protein